MKYYSSYPGTAYSDREFGPMGFERNSVYQAVRMCFHLYMRRLFLLLLCCHRLCGSAHALWTEAVCHTEKMQDHPLCVLVATTEQSVVLALVWIS
jgi:hypothetical protein